MDALRALTEGQGCAVDGTGATANPLSQLVNQTLNMGGPKGAVRGGQQQPFQGQQPGFAHHGPPSDLDRGMNAAMMGHRPQGMFAPPPGPMSAGPMMHHRAPGPGALMHPMGAGPASFVHEFEQQFAGNGPPPPQLQARGHPENWVQDFQRMNLGGANPMERAFRQNFGGPHRGGAAWAQVMARPPPPPELEQAWRQQMPDGNQWASELAARAPEEASAAKQSPQDADAALRATEEMVRALSQNPKFRDSEFFDFMSKVSTGELKFEDNQVVPGEARSQDAATTARDPMAEAWTQATAQHGESIEEMFAKAWRESGEGGQTDLDAMWAKMFMQNNMAGVMQESEGMPWGETAWEELANSATPVDPLEAPYELTENNPYAQNKQAYEDGMKFFGEGRLQDALMAFHAAVEQDPSHADAWRMLGVVHQENDEDKKAILCLERAVEQDAYHLDALLALGVSYVNELDHDRALKNLKAWIINNPAFQGLEVSHDAYSDGSLMDDVMQLMIKAEKWAPNDAGVQEVLGVLYNVSKDYESAVRAFRKAQSARPNDHTLWNKLGATFANGFKSEDAIPQYLRALELRPGYARCLLNLGISYSNLGNYEAAAKAYLRALVHSPDAHHVWGYLRICFTSMDRFDLIPLTDKRDLPALRKMFNV